MSALSLFNVALDSYSVVLSAIIAAYVLVNDDRSDSVSLWFAGLCAVNALMALGDMTTWTYDLPLAGMSFALLVVGNFVFWLMPALAFVCYAGYLNSFVRRRATVRVGRPLLVAAGVLGACYVVGCVASLFLGLFFEVTPEAGYARGPWFWLGQALPGLLYAVSGLMVWNYRAHLRRVERLSFLSYLALPLVAEVIQAANYGIALLNTGITLAILVIFMNIQTAHRAELAERNRELAEARGDIMLSQIQPHFLYNTLAAIRNLCLTDPPEAARTVTNFSRYLRQNMASLTSKEPIAFERELSHVQTYLELERRRFGNRLRVEWDIGSTDFSLPPLVVQPLVENAVRHGVTCRPEGGCVRVSSRAEGATRVVVVEDDGVGFVASSRPDDGRQHVGIENVRSRLAAICGGTLEVKSTPGQGTVCRLTVPQMVVPAPRP